MPTKNRPERLASTLETLKAQEYPYWEVLVVDDGYGQGVKVATTINDSRIKGYHNAGRGQVDARNTAITLSKGEVIALLDDDDWWEDVDHLQKIVEALKQQPALVHRHGWVVLEKESLEKEYLPYTLSATTESLFKDNTLLTSSVAYPKNWHKELGLFDRSVGGYFDWDWYLQVIKAGYNLHTINSLGVCYLRHSENGSKETHSQRRTKNFEAFRDKHGLEVEIKNHMQVLLDKEVSNLR